jgi:acyl-CoA synthetase (AMP-forming)/AMP-acid ligase II
VGQPLPGVEIRLQSEAGKLVTDENNPGEILVSGPHLALQGSKQAIGR